MQPELELSGATWRATTIASHYQAVERVILAIRERIAEPITLQDMAEIAFLSPYHFDRVFRQITGIPPCQFLSALRLEAAKRLLLTTGLSVIDICFEVGYNSLGSFTTRFTQLVGLPPRRLRLAKDITFSYLESLQNHNGNLFPILADGFGITGRVSAPDGYIGPIFVGIFPTAIPQSQPTGCVLLTAPGSYRIAPVPDGRYYIFAAAFDCARKPFSYLLPEEGPLHVGTGRGPLLVRRGQASGHTDIILRPLRLTDPPLLIALPFLLAKQLDY